MRSDIIEARMKAMKKLLSSVNKVLNTLVFDGESIYLWTVCCFNVH